MNELAERDATGHIATTDDEIRRFCAVPYVSSMPRQIPALPALVDVAALPPAERGVAVLAVLSPLPETPPMPPPEEFGSVLSALVADRKTSPEMVVFSRLIRDALPA